jgi:hypothetical protein
MSVADIHWQLSTVITWERRAGVRRSQVDEVMERHLARRLPGCGSATDTQRKE